MAFIQPDRGRRPRGFRRLSRCRARRYDRRGRQERPQRQAAGARRPLAEMMRLVLDTNVLLSALMSPASLSAEQAWSARRLRLPTPEEAESLAVPTQERVR